MIQGEYERMLANMVKKFECRKRLDESRQSVPSAAGSSGFPETMAGPSATKSPSVSVPAFCVAQTAPGSNPVTSQSFQPSTNIFEQIGNVRRKHRRTNIKTRLILDEVR